MAEAIELVASKRDGDGRWPLETRHPGEMPVEIGYPFWPYGPESAIITCGTAHAASYVAGML